MDLQESLKRFGLSTTEAKIYLALLKAKESTVDQLAKETDVHRRTIYDNLNLLLRKGLVSFKIKNRVKYFEATNPKSLRVFLEEKSKVLEDVMPTLKEFYESEQKSPKINVYIGLEGAKAIVEEAVNSGKDSYWVGGGLFLFKALEYSREFVEGKLKKMKIKIVQPDIPESRELTKFVKKKNIRLLPKNFVVRTGYLVYGDTVAIGIIQEREVTTIHIISKECAEAFRNYFDTMWSIAKPLR